MARERPRWLHRTNVSALGLRATARGGKGHPPPATTQAALPASAQRNLVPTGRVHIMLAAGWNGLLLLLAGGAALGGSLEPLLHWPVTFFHILGPLSMGLALVAHILLLVVALEGVYRAWRLLPWRVLGMASFGLGMLLFVTQWAAPPIGIF